MTEQGHVEDDPEVEDGTPEDEDEAPESPKNDVVDESEDDPKT